MAVVIERTYRNGLALGDDRTDRQIVEEEEVDVTLTPIMSWTQHDPIRQETCCVLLSKMQSLRVQWEAETPISTDQNSYNASDADSAAGLEWSLHLFTIDSVYRAVFRFPGAVPSPSVASGCSGVVFLSTRQVLVQVSARHSHRDRAAAMDLFYLPSTFERVLPTSTSWRRVASAFAPMGTAAEEAQLTSRAMGKGKGNALPDRLRLVNKSLLHVSAAPVGCTDRSVEVVFLMAYQVPTDGTKTEARKEAGNSGQQATAAPTGGDTRYCFAVGIVAVSPAADNVLDAHASSPQSSSSPLAPPFALQTQLRHLFVEVNVPFAASLLGPPTTRAGTGVDVPHGTTEMAGELAPEEIQWLFISSLEMGGRHEDGTLVGSLVGLLPHIPTASRTPDGLQERMNVPVNVHCSGMGVMAPRGAVGISLPPASASLDGLPAEEEEMDMERGDAVDTTRLLLQLSADQCAVYIAEVGPPGTRLSAATATPSTALPRPRRKGPPAMVTFVVDFIRPLLRGPDGNARNAAYQPTQPQGLYVAVDDAWREVCHQRHGSDGARCCVVPAATSWCGLVPLPLFVGVASIAVKQAWLSDATEPNGQWAEVEAALRESAGYGAHEVGLLFRSIPAAISAPPSMGPSGAMREASDAVAIYAHLAHNPLTNELRVALVHLPPPSCDGRGAVEEATQRSCRDLACLPPSVLWCDTAEVDHRSGAVIANDASDASAWDAGEAVILRQVEWLASEAVRAVDGASTDAQCWQTARVLLRTLWNVMTVQSRPALCRQLLDVLDGTPFDDFIREMRFSDYAHAVVTLLLSAQASDPAEVAAIRAQMEDLAARVYSIFMQLVISVDWLGAAGHSTANALLRWLVLLFLGAGDETPGAAPTQRCHSGGPSAMRPSEVSSSGNNYSFCAIKSSGDELRALHVLFCLHETASLRVRQTEHAMLRWQRRMMLLYAHRQPGVPIELLLEDILKTASQDAATTASTRETMTFALFQVVAESPLYESLGLLPVAIPGMSSNASSCGRLTPLDLCDLLCGWEAAMTEQPQVLRWCGCVVDVMRWALMEGASEAPLAPQKLQHLVVAVLSAWERGHTYDPARSTADDGTCAPYPVCLPTFLLHGLEASTCRHFPWLALSPLCIVYLWFHIVERWVHRATDNEAPVPCEADRQAPLTPTCFWKRYTNEHHEQLHRLREAVHVLRWLSGDTEEGASDVLRAMYLAGTRPHAGPGAGAPLTLSSLRQLLHLPVQHFVSDERESACRDDDDVGELPRLACMLHRCFSCAKNKVLLHLLRSCMPIKPAESNSPTGSYQGALARLYAHAQGYKALVTHPMEDSAALAQLMSRLLECMYRYDAEALGNTTLHENMLVALTALREDSVAPAPHIASLLLRLMRPVLLYAYPILRWQAQEELEHRGRAEGMHVLPHLPQYHSLDLGWEESTTVGGRHVASAVTTLCAGAAAERAHCLLTRLFRLYRDVHLGVRCLDALFAQVSHPAALTARSPAGTPSPPVGSPASAAAGQPATPSRTVTPEPETELKPESFVLPPSAAYVVACLITSAEPGRLVVAAEVLRRQLLPYVWQRVLQERLVVPRYPNPSESKLGVPPEAAATAAVETTCQWEGRPFAVKAFLNNMMEELEECGEAIAACAPFYGTLIIFLYMDVVRELVVSGTVPAAATEGGDARSTGTTGRSIVFAESTVQEMSQCIRTIAQRHISALKEDERKRLRLVISTQLCTYLDGEPTSAPLKGEGEVDSTKRRGAREAVLYESSPVHQHVVGTVLPRLANTIRDVGGRTALMDKYVAVLRQVMPPVTTAAVLPVPTMPESTARGTGASEDAALQSNVEERPSSLPTTFISHTILRTLSSAVAPLPPTQRAGSSHQPQSPPLSSEHADRARLLVKEELYKRRCLESDEGRSWSAFVSGKRFRDALAHLYVALRYEKRRKEMWHYVMEKSDIMLAFQLRLLVLLQHRCVVEARTLADRMMERRRELTQRLVRMEKAERMGVEALCFAEMRSLFAAQEEQDHVWRLLAHSRADLCGMEKVGRRTLMEACATDLEATQQREATKREEAMWAEEEARWTKELHGEDSHTSLASTRRGSRREEGTTATRGASNAFLRWQAQQLAQPGEPNPPSMVAAPSPHSTIPPPNPPIMPPEPPLSSPPIPTLEQRRHNRVPEPAEDLTTRHGFSHVVEAGETLAGVFSKWQSKLVSVVAPAPTRARGTPPASITSEPLEDLGRPSAPRDAWVPPPVECAVPLPPVGVGNAGGVDVEEKSVSVPCARQVKANPVVENEVVAVEPSIATSLGIQRPTAVRGETQTKSRRKRGLMAVAIDERAKMTVISSAPMQLEVTAGVQSHMQHTHTASHTESAVISPSTGQQHTDEDGGRKSRAPSAILRHCEEGSRDEHTDPTDATAISRSPSFDGSSVLLAEKQGRVALVLEELHARSLVGRGRLLQAP